MGDRAERIRIERLDSERPDGERSEGDGGSAQWRAVLAAADAGPVPVGPGGAGLRWLAWSGAGDGDGARAGSGDDVAVGAAWLRSDGRFLTAVLPDRTGDGAGAALLDAVRSAAAAEGTADVLRTGAAKGSDAEALLVAAGFQPGEETQRMLLRVEDCDPDALRAIVRAASDGYHLVRWQGVAPADLLAPYAATRDALDGTAVGGPGWDEARVRAAAEETAARGQTRLTVAALGLDPLGDEVVAGFSEILLPGRGGVPTGRGAARAMQSDTAVLKPHRGRGLGLWVKAAMLQWLLGAHPEVEAVETVCRIGNTHMIEINETLGFRPEAREVPYQLALRRA
ncbi:hypothetical protein [Streptacidiphilus cavernicola]|uniref:GNAT family N-acetyltransferase n=1 Tax=Streptacidiphilus cavernicola TaxID=3342716 RepID=A0ABV6W5D5_9ACTN